MAKSKILTTIANIIEDMCYNISDIARVAEEKYGKENASHIIQALIRLNDIVLNEDETIVENDDVIIFHHNGEVHYLDAYHGWYDLDKFMCLPWQEILGCQLLIEEPASLIDCYVDFIDTISIEGIDGTKEREWAEFSYSYEEYEKSLEYGDD